MRDAERKIHIKRRAARNKSKLKFRLRNGQIQGRTPFVSSNPRPWKKNSFPNEGHGSISPRNPKGTVRRTPPHAEPDDKIKLKSSKRYKPNGQKSYYPRWAFQEMAMRQTLGYSSDRVRGIHWRILLVLSCLVTKNDLQKMFQSSINCAGSS